AAETACRVRHPNARKEPDQPAKEANTQAAQKGGAETSFTGVQEAGANAQIQPLLLACLHEQRNLRGIMLAVGIELNDVVITTTEVGKPIARLHGGANAGIHGQT